MESEIVAILDNPATPQLVQAYFSPENLGFAGRLFNTLGNNDPNEITAEDLVAVSMLDVAFKARAVRFLLEDESEHNDVSKLLADIPQDVPLGKASSEIERGSAAWQLWDKLHAYYGVGPARASKLMARKRPRLVPIQDSVVKDVLPSAHGDYWTRLGAALTEERLSRIEELREGLPQEVSSLRLLDVAIWMLGSDAGTAQEARAQVGAPRAAFEASSSPGSD